MEVLKIIKRLASYGVFIAAATLFLLNTTTVALAPYIHAEHSYDYSYLPFMYAIISLGVLLLFQLIVIGKPKEIEENIYPWLLIVLFAVMLFVSVLILGRGIVACSDDPTKDVSYVVAGMTPSLILSLVEVVIGLIMLFKKQNSSAKTPLIDENGVNLTKEE